MGVQDRVEIWDKALWEERSMVSEEDLDAIAERMRRSVSEFDSGQRVNGRILWHLNTHQFYLKRQ